MSNVFATITIEQKDEGDLAELLKKMHLDCDCHGYTCSIRGKDVTKYTLDLTEECLEVIKNNIQLLHLTITKYSLGPLGLKIINKPETIM